MTKMKKEGIKLFIVALASFLMLVCIVAASPDSTLQFIDPTPANSTQEQDFTCGVLAINTHKSIYFPDETAFVGIAVLDNEGHMVCDADVTLTITDPGNNETVLSTGNGSINVSPQCCVYGVTNLPDFYTNYTVGGAGTYVMNLAVTAVTADGTKSITDEFTVQNSVDFDVARDGATRIYPPVPYVMNFTIKANKNYTGLIREYVPASFVITPQDCLIVTTVGDTDTKILTWTKNLAKGETYNLYYEFDAPNVSPYLYLLGPLEIGKFKEIRQWQIASDLSEGPKYPTSESTSAESPYVNCIWLNLANVGADDGNYADTGKNQMDTLYYSYVLNAATFGFSIPAGATIKGIKVEYGRHCDKTNNVVDSLVQLIKEGTRQGNDKSTGSDWNGGTDTTVTFGGETDLWGLSWTTAHINADDFGVAVACQSMVNNENPEINFLRITVYYTTPTWESYKTDGHSIVWGYDTEHAYDSEWHIVYMSGAGFKTSYDDYKVGYYDGSATGGGQLVGAAGGGTSTPGGDFLSQRDCRGTGATEGTWHSVVLDTTGNIPNTYDVAIEDANYVIKDEFEVAESAIPEFPDVIAAIAVCMLCAIPYIVMRRKVIYGK